MINKEIKKVNLTQIKNFLKKTFSFGEKTWFFTIIFFVVAFIFSLWTWWNCILNPSPSEQVVLDFQKEQKEFEIKSKKIESVIEKIQDRKIQFNQADDHQLERKIFKSKEDIFQEMNSTSDNFNSSGVNRAP
ncbi:MAG: hypothetical protein PF549_01905 [Patescibacteria group bacterium]|jgi:hypothetical protein|nr:hypothetical protein [Patescibacteria group bacterium]